MLSVVPLKVTRAQFRLSRRPWAILDVSEIWESFPGDILRTTHMESLAECVILHHPVENIPLPCHVVVFVELGGQMFISNWTARNAGYSNRVVRRMFSGKVVSRFWYISWPLCHLSWALVGFHGVTSKPNTLTNLGHWSIWRRQLKKKSQCQQSTIFVDSS